MKERNFGVASVVSATGLLVCGLISFMWLRQNHRDWAAALNTVTMILIDVRATRGHRQTGQATRYRTAMVPDLAQSGGSPMSRGRGALLSIFQVAGTIG